MNETQDALVVSARILRANLAEYVEAARQGKTVVITNHGEPVAELRPTKARVRTVVKTTVVA